MNESEILRQAIDGRGRALERHAGQQATLPLKYLRQQAHFTVPAADPVLAAKGIGGAHIVAGRVLAKFSVTPAEVGERLGVPVAVVEEVLAARAPLVLLDLEDGIPANLAEAARGNAVELLLTADWGSSLRYIRGPGILDERCAPDLTHILMGCAAGRTDGSYPVDGIVFPKVRFVEEIEWLYALLGEIEHAIGLRPNQVRVSLQLETASGVLALPELAMAARDRLSGIILGAVDLSADLLLPEARYRHPICEWTRAMIVTAAGAVGVPAIDSMTLNFPVAAADLSLVENHDRLLDRMEENFKDALYSIEYGMAGRWVGHPLQLISTILAYRSAFGADFVAKELAEVREFQGAIDSGLGAVAGKGGVLLDLATDRHARRLLRRAVAWGLVAPQEAVRLNLATWEELGLASTEA